MAEALYRKYRPQIFEDVVGQEHIERTIKNAIEQDKVSHAYLFTGPRGTGKTTTARLLAKALLCQSGPTPEPDGTCEDCEMIAAGEHPDVYELDAASRTGVDNVREEIIGRVQFAPTRGRCKIYIIDEVHMLSTAAFNALLKTLEEPPSHVVFILATTDPQKVPETIHSRCQRFDFRRISHESIVSRLGAICVAEDVEFEGEALDLIAHRAEGGMRNALTSLEQLIAFGEGKVTMEVAERMLGSLASNDLAEIVRFVGTRDVAACFRWTADYVETGADLAQFVRDMAEHMRNMYVMSLAGADVALEVSESARRELAEELRLFGPDRLARMMGVLGDLSAELKTSTNPRLSFEIALTRMVRPDSDLTLESLAERVEALESGYSAVAHVVTSAEPSGPMQAQARGAAQTATHVQPQHQGQADAQMGSHGARADVRAGVQMGGTLADAQGAQSAQAQANATTRLAQREGAQPQEQGQEGAWQPQAASQVGERAQVQREDVSGFGFEAQGQAQGRTPQPAEGSSASFSATGAVPARLVESMSNPAALQRMWQSALAALKKAKAAYGVLFLNTKASFDASAAALVIEFPAENDFAFRAVQKPDVQDELTAALTHACGAPLPFRLMKAGQGIAAGGMGVAAASASAARQGAQSQPQQLSQARTQAQAQRAQQLASQQAQLAQQAASQQAQRAQAAAQPAQAHPAAQSAQAHPAAQPTQAVAQRTQAQPAQGGYSDDDQVPVDLYDDMVPYDDGGYGSSYYAESAPWESEVSRASQAPSGAQPASRPVQSASQPAQLQPQPQPQSATAQPQPQSVTAPPAQSAPAASEPSLSDLDAMLAFGFGADVSFTEVND